MCRCTFLFLLIVSSFSFAGNEPTYLCITPDGRPDLSRESGEDCAKLPDMKNPRRTEKNAFDELAKKAAQRRKESWQKLSPGMSKAAVTNFWETPNKEQTRRVQTRNGVIEEWRFPGYGKLTFQNGVLEVIED